MNEKEKELLLKGINLGIFLALADTEADLESRLSTVTQIKADEAAKADEADEKTLDDLRSQIEVYNRLRNDYTGYKCNSITKRFSDLTIDECSLVYASIKELCIDNTKEVYNEFDYIIKEVLLHS